MASNSGQRGGAGSGSRRGSYGSSGNGRSRQASGRGRRVSSASGRRRKERRARRRKIMVLVAAVAIIAAVIIGIYAVTGSSGSTDYTQSTAEFMKDGSVRVTSVELFDQDYYDENELEETIQEALKTYRETYGDGVSEHYLNVADGTATLVMTYDSAEDYVNFNETDLYVGTVAGAEAAGYDFQSIMAAVSQEDTSRILTQATLEQLQENEVIILFEQTDVVTYKNMLYATPNLGVTDGTHATAIDMIDEDTPAIVILVDD